MTDHRSPSPSAANDGRAPSSTKDPAALKREDRSARIAVTVFPALILAAAALGFFVPAAGQSIAAYVPVFLSVIMFGMGLTLTIPDFTLVVRRPLPVQTANQRRRSALARSSRYRALPSTSMCHAIPWQS